MLTQLSHAWAQPIDEPIHLVRLAAGLTYLANKYVAVQSNIESEWASLHPHEAVFFAVIQPVARAARANDALQLISLDPDELVHAVVAGLIVKMEGTSREKKNEIRVKVTA